VNARRLFWLGALVVLVVAVLTNLTFQERQLEKEIARDVTAVDRFIDISVRLRTVVADPEGDELIDGKPNLRVVHERLLGGLLDTKAGRLVRIDPDLLEPVDWFCSEEQEAILFARKPTAQLVEGSEGSGKTTLLAEWHYVQWLSHLGEKREGLQTAPTNVRLGLVKREIGKLWRPTWYRYVNRKDFVGYELCEGSAIRMVSTHKQSEAGGSPVQGFNASWAGADEKQDQIEVHDDVESRGRASRDGVFPQLGTATVKDSTAYRNLKSRIVTGGEWALRSLVVCREIPGEGAGIHFEMCTPFVTRAFVESKLASMTEREFRRRFFAEDQGPERMLYHTWSRANLRAIPANAVDVTERELRGEGNMLALRVGFDPGNLFDVSIPLKAFRIPGHPRPFWWVVGEITTEQSTTDVHIKELLRVAGARWNCNLRDRKGVIVGPQIAVRADPYGDTGNDANRPDITVYKSFRNAGIIIRPAAYTPSTTKVMVAKVPKEARIDMVCTLLRAANGERRLFVDVDERGQAVAPKLVEAFEMMERDEAGQAETQKKNKKDMSHWPAAVGYGLWSIEKPRIEALRRAA